MRRRLSLISLLLMLLAVACAPTVPAAPASAAPTRALSGATSTAVAAAPAPAAGAPAAGADAPLRPPVAVKVGMVPTTGSTAPYLAAERGYFREEGLDVSFESFDTGGQVIPALGTGQIDVGSGAVSAGLFNAIARGVELKLVATISTMQPGHGVLSFLVRRDLWDSGAVRGAADLRGRKLALAAKGNIAEAVLDRLLARGGLTVADVDLSELPQPEMIAALANGAIDVAIQGEPTATASVERGIGVRWLTADELYPGLITGVWVYSAPFAAECTEAARRFMVGLLRAQRDYTDAFERGVDREGVIEVLMRHTPVKERALYERLILPAVAPDGYIDPAALQTDLDWYVQRGYVAPGLTAASLIDARFVDYAVARLGRYE